MPRYYNFEHIEPSWVSPLILRVEPLPSMVYTRKNDMLVISTVTGFHSSHIEQKCYI